MAIHNCYVLKDACQSLPYIFDRSLKLELMDSKLSEYNTGVRDDKKQQSVTVRHVCSYYLPRYLCLGTYYLPVCIV